MSSPAEGLLKTRLSPRQLWAFAGSRTGVLALTTAGNLVVRTGSSMLLTRLLTPDAFGIVGIITSVFFAVTMVTDLGFQDFLIRHERTEERHFRDVVWTIHVVRGVAIFIAVAITSPIIAQAFGKPVVALPLAAASFIFITNGIASLSLMTALRHDKSRELSLLEFGLQIVQTVICVLLALWWRNAWSIIAAMVLQSGFRTVLSYRLFPDSAQHLARDREISREFGTFSRFVMASSIMALLIGQSDKLVLGRVFTLAQFGLYAIALTIASAPVAFAQSYVNRIHFPICARVWREEPENLSAVYYRVRRLPAALYGFACGGLIGSAALVIAVLYDPRYASASTFMSLLMIGTSIGLPNMAASQLMVVIGQVKKTAHITLARLLWVLAAIPLGLLLLGPMGVVVAIGTIELPATVYCWVLLHRIRVLKIREELAFLAIVVAGAVIGWIGGTEILHLFPNL